MSKQITPHKLQPSPETRECSFCNEIVRKEKTVKVCCATAVLICFACIVLNPKFNRNYVCTSCQSQIEEQYENAKNLVKRLLSEQEKLGKGFKVKQCGKGDNMDNLPSFGNKRQCSFGKIKQNHNKLSTSPASKPKRQAVFSQEI